MAVIARGLSVDLDRWELDVESNKNPGWVSASVRVWTALGTPLWGVGCAGPALGAGDRQELCVGANNTGPRTLIARVEPEVRSVVVWLSDATREHLMVYKTGADVGDGIAVLVYPRPLDVRDIELRGHGGRLLSPQHS